MKKEQFNIYLSYLMRHAWSIQRKNGKPFKKALIYTWKITNEERNNTAIPFITAQWMQSINK